MTYDTTRWLNGTIGEHTFLERLPSSARKATKGQLVSRLEDGRGRRWVLKRVGVGPEWAAEVAAYENWARSLAGLVPDLVASEAELRLLLLSDVPGHHPNPSNKRAQRQAGALLRRLHEADAPRPRDLGDQDRVNRRVERLLRESRSVLTAEEEQFVRRQAARQAEVSPGRMVPCHGDYRPHNWLIDPSRTLRAIDFGKSCWNPPVWDLTKLFFKPWWGRPGLAAAFFAGYGRSLDAEERTFLLAQLAINATAHTAFGVRRNSPRHVRLGRSRLDDLRAGSDAIDRMLLRV